MCKNIRFDTDYIIHKSQRKYLRILRLIVKLKQQNNSTAHRANKKQTYAWYGTFAWYAPWQPMNGSKSTGFITTFTSFRHLTMAYTYMGLHS